MSKRFKLVMSFLGGAALGGTAMYLFDPVQGRRRRALIRDQVVHGWRQGKWSVRGSSVDLAHRVQGAFAETRSRFLRHPVPDDVLVARVRSKVGRLVAHPHAIEVSAADGRVSLSGPVLESEVERLISTVFSVRGVSEVYDRLAVYKDGSHIPALQGAGRRRRA